MEAWKLLTSVAVAATICAAQPRFDVASIKPTSELGSRDGLEILPGGSFHMTGATLKDLICFAYGVNPRQVSGGPSWAGSTGYDIFAKPEHPDGPEDGPMPAPGTPSWTRLEQRLQALLAERFQLVIRKEEKPAQVMLLTVAKGGPKLQDAKNPNQPSGTMRSRNSITGRAGTMPMLAGLLSNWMGKPVEDRTGLTGKYDYKVEYAPEGGPSDSIEASLPGPSLMVALEEQLGLKLQSGRGTSVTLVIERAAKPAN